MGKGVSLGFKPTQILQCAKSQSFQVGKCIYESIDQLNFGSSRIVVELSEADQDPLLKIDKIPKSVTHAFHCLDRIVNTFNDARGHPMREVV